MLLTVEFRLLIIKPKKVPMEKLSRRKMKNCLEDTCMEGSKLTAVEWFYSLLTLLLTSNQHSLA